MVTTHPNHLRPQQTYAKHQTLSLRRKPDGLRRRHIDLGRGRTDHPHRVGATASLSPVDGWGRGWFDGSWRRFTQADVDCKITSLPQMASKRARARGLKLERRITDEEGMVVYMRAVEDA